MPETFDMPSWRGDDGTIYVWDAATKSYTATTQDQVSDRGHASGGDNDLFSPNQWEHHEQTGNPLGEGAYAHVKQASTDYVPERTDITEQEFFGVVADLGWQIVENEPRREHSCVVLDNDGNYIHASFGTDDAGVLVSLERFGGNRIDRMLDELAPYLGHFWSEHEDEYWEHPFNDYGDEEEDPQTELERREDYMPEEAAKEWPDTPPEDWTKESALRQATAPPPEDDEFYIVNEVAEDAALYWDGLVSQATEMGQPLYDVMPVLEDYVDRVIWQIAEDNIEQYDELAELIWKRIISIRPNIKPFEEGAAPIEQGAEQAAGNWPNTFPEHWAQVIATWRKEGATNPINYEFIPLTDFELGMWDNLSKRDKQVWHDRAKNLNRRAIKWEESGRVNGRELHAIAQRYENNCAYCDKPLAWGGGGEDEDKIHPQAQNADNAGTIDHNISLSQGGGGTVENMLPACWQCNKDLNQWDRRDNPLAPRAESVEPNPLAFDPAVASTAGEWLTCPHCGSDDNSESRLPNGYGYFYRLCNHCNEYFDADGPAEPGDPAATLTVPEHWGGVMVDDVWGDLEDEAMPQKTNPVRCPNCGSEAETDVCPTCGKGLGPEWSKADQETLPSEIPPQGEFASEFYSLPDRVPKRQNMAPNRTDDSFPSMISKVATHEGTTTHVLKDSMEPSLDECPECGGPLFDRGKEKHCSECGHRQPIIEIAASTDQFYNKKTGKLSKGLLLVAAIEGKRVGYLIAEARDEGYVTDYIEVSPDFRRKGIASALVHRGRDFGLIPDVDVPDQVYQSEEGRALAEKTAGAALLAVPEVLGIGGAEAAGAGAVGGEGLAAGAGGMGGMGSLMSGALGRGMAFRAGEDLLGGGQQPQGTNDAASMAEPLIAPGVVGHYESWEHAASAEEQIDTLSTWIMDHVPEEIGNPHGEGGGIPGDEGGGDLAVRLLDRHFGADSEGPYGGPLYEGACEFCGDQSQGVYHTVHGSICPTCSHGDMTHKIADTFGEEETGQATKNRGTNSTDEASASGIAGKEEQGDSPEQLKDVGDGSVKTDPDEATPQAEQHGVLQDTAMKAFEANMPLVIEFATSDQAGADHPILKALDELLEEAFPGYKDQHEGETEVGPEQHPEEHAVESHRFLTEDEARAAAKTAAGIPPNEGLRYLTPDEVAETVDGISQNTYLHLWDIVTQLEQAGQDAPMGGDVHDPHGEFGPPTVEDPGSRRDLVMEGQGNMVSVWDQLTPEEQQEINTAMEARDAEIDAVMEGLRNREAALTTDPTMTQGTVGEPPIPTGVGTCPMCGQNHASGTPCPTNPNSMLQPGATPMIMPMQQRMGPPAPQTVVTHTGDTNCSSCGQTDARTKAGGVKCLDCLEREAGEKAAEGMIPIRQAALPGNASCNACGWVWGVAPKDRDNPDKMRCPACGSSDTEHDMASSKPKEAALPSHDDELELQAERNRPDEHAQEHHDTGWYEDWQPEEDPKHPWIDDNGKALETGQDYELHSTDYAIPDKITVETVTPAKLTFILHSGDVDYRDELSPEEIQTYGYTFTQPEQALDSESGFPAADKALGQKAQHADYPRNQDSVNQVDDLSGKTGGADSNTYEQRRYLECPACNQGLSWDGITQHVPGCPEAVGYDDVGERVDTPDNVWRGDHPGPHSPRAAKTADDRYVASEFQDPEKYYGSFEGDDPSSRSWLGGESSPVDVDPELMAKLAGKDFSPREQRRFIDEDGEARNLHRLDLEGTHYVDDDAYGDSLW